MRRIVCTGFGDPLDLVEEPTPEVGPRDVLIEMVAAGVSFVDGLIVSGRYQLRPELPFTPGSVIAGRVVERGREVDSVAATRRPRVTPTPLGTHARPLGDPARLPTEPDGTFARPG